MTWPYPDRLGSSARQVVGVETLCTVQWQDGNEAEAELPAATVGLGHPAPHDLFPG